MHSLKFILVAFCCLALGAQAKNEGPLRITFDEAVSRSLEQSFTIGRAKADLIATEADRLKTIAQVGPRISASYNYTVFDHDIEDGGIVYRAQIQQVGTFVADINLAAVVASLQKLKMQTSQIGLSRKAREIAATETAFGVAEIYRMAQQSTEAIVVAKSRMEATAKNQRDAEALLAYGKIAKTDKLQIDIVHNQALIDLARAENDSLNVQAALKKFLNIDSDQALDLEPLKILAKDMLPQMPDPQNALVTAFQNRDDIEVSRLKLSIMERARWLTLSPYIPSVDVSMNWQRNFGALNVLSDNLTQYFQINATWTFWDNGAALLDFRKSQMDVRKARIDKQEATIDLKIDVEKSSRNLDLAKETLRLSELSLEQAQEAYRGMTLKFSLGAASVTDLLYAESTFNKAKLDHLAAIVGLDIGYMKMRKALGDKRPLPL